MGLERQNGGETNKGVNVAWKTFKNTSECYVIEECL